jgi:hypothetical protein
MLAMEVFAPSPHLLHPELNISHPRTLYLEASLWFKGTLIGIMCFFHEEFRVNSCIELHPEK